MELKQYGGGTISSSLSRRKNAAKRRERDKEQARLINPAENSGPRLAPIRTPTFIFCKKCMKRMIVTDQDTKTKEFIKCPICGTPYPIWYEIKEQPGRKKK